MDLGTFINNNWQTLGGIASFIFLAGVTYSKIQDSEKTRRQDMKEMSDRGKVLKDAYDEKINDMQLKLTALEIKQEEMKDKTFEVISTMQQDIREIMTILKRDK